MKKAFFLLELVFVIIISGLIFSFLLRPVSQIFSSFIKTKQINELSYDVNQALILLKTELNLCLDTTINPTSFKCVQKLDAMFLGENLEKDIGYSGILFKNNLKYISPKSHFYELGKDRSSLGVSSDLADFSGYLKRQGYDLWLKNLQNGRIYKAQASEVNPDSLLFNTAEFSGFYEVIKGEFRIFLDGDELKASLKLPNGFEKEGVMLKNVKEFTLSKNSDSMDARLCIKLLKDQDFCLNRTFLLP